LKILTTLLLIVIVVLANTTTHAQKDNLWFINNLTTYKAETYTIKDVKYEYLGSQNHCQPYKIITNNIPREVCATLSARHPVVGSQVIFAGSNNYHYFYDTAYTNALYQPLPYQDFIIQQDRKGSSARLKIIYDAYNFNGANKIEINNQTKLLVKNKNYKYIKDNQNNDLLSELGTPSSNGLWYVGQNVKGLYIINLITLEFKYIRAGLYTANGISPRLKMAISDDGSTVAYYSGNKNIFELIDTTNCQNNNATTGTIANCRFMSLNKTIEGSVVAPSTPLDHDRIEFINNNTLSMFVYNKWDKQTSDYTAQRLYVSNSGNADISGLNYLALGDSYASGEGAYSYKNGTDEPWNKCHLSAESYPFLLHQNAQLGPTQSVACSGARMKDVVNINNTEYSKDNPQSKKYNSKDNIQLILNNFYTGSIRQINFVELYKPKIITLSISGNDIGFSKIIAKCLSSSQDCYNNYQERQQLVTIINAQYGNLVKTLKEIKKYAPIDSRIYLLGYPKVVATDGQCAKNVPLSYNERAFANDLVEYFNQVISMASVHSGVHYVNVEEAFNGSKLCQDKSSNVAINGLTAGNDSPLKEFGPLGQETFHPNKKGHQLYANSIAKATNNLTAPMPSVIPDNPYLIAEESIKLLQNYPKEPAITEYVYYDEDFINNVIYKDKTAKFNINGQNYNLKPNSSVNITAYSIPTNLGDYPLNDYGDAEIDIPIPTKLSAGYHTIHIKGTNIFDNTVDIQKIVYVGQTELDIDGDGIPNTKELCLANEPANIDIDGDKIDDACDSFIAEPKNTTTISIIDGNNNKTTANIGDIGVVKTPTINITNKPISISESRPNWLLDIEAELQRPNVSVANPTSNTVVNNISSQTNIANAVITNDNADPTANQNNQPQTSSATQVRGLQQVKPLTQTSKTKTNNWLVTLAVIFGLTSIVAYIATKKMSK
jgi:lysophospholipase L1-like esterase